MNENEISKIIIGCAIEVHKQLGPGLLESAYQECLYYELIQAGLNVKKENKVVVEIKTVEELNDVHTAQVLTYLKPGNYKLGLLLNFQVSLLNNGIKRIIM